ncbi:cyclodeaminase/cyclohydrolase family protein [Clostridium vincentii]|uniref:Methenyltetrahydrofolate cyclohydrolase n=1 Tax=Clostridium vincentii TaxID=52704 RepID=A0A2T0BGF8_9CLOT|nr:cyclodeaminase/cyclohydrolase family protein [Clostridium vincentii]PRR82917.1 Methenyltetrahydrofolate cyclohydrolase [Clostridium vincentii]
MHFKDYKIEEFVEDLSSKSSSPGGGSVAGLVSALAGSLNSMVYSLTVNKKAFEALDEDSRKLVLEFKKEASEFTNKSLELMEKDRKYFNELMDCYKLQKNTEEEKYSRDKAIAEGTLRAMNPPLELAEEAYKFYDNIEIAIKYGNKMLISDAGCAAILIYAAIECAIINVKVNLNYLRDKSFSKKVEYIIIKLEANSLKKRDSIMNIVNKTIYP